MCSAGAGYRGSLAPPQPPSNTHLPRSYLAHGTATDYMYEKLGVPISMTWEVYGDQKAAFEDCFRMFNPLTPATFNATLDSWAAAFFTMLTLLPGHPQVAAEVTGLPRTGLPQAQVGAASGASAGGALGRKGGDGSTGDGSTVAQQQAQEVKEQAKEQAAQQAAQQGAAGASGSSEDQDQTAAEIATALKDHILQQEGSKEQQPSDADEDGSGPGGWSPSDRQQVLFWLVLMMTGVRGGWR